MAHNGWVPLILSNPPESIPEPLIKSSFTQNSYTVCLTDFCRVWRQSADRRQILRQALNDDSCSIDPSEDAAQLKILLDKIQGALNNESGTQRSLLIKPSSLETLSLKLTAPLPAPLEPLNWQLVLHLEPAESIRSELVLPLVATAYALRTSAEDLVNHLKEKDHVIDKLLDKLEASRTDLASLFPGIAGTKGSKGENQRALAARHIKGLRVFDEAEWKSSLQNKCANPPPAREIFAGIIDSEDILSANWWPQLSSKADESGLAAEVKIERGRGKESSADEDGSDFQRQPTPPGLRKTVGRDKASSKPQPSASLQADPEKGNADDETTEDEDDDLDIASTAPSARAVRSNQAIRTLSAAPQEQKRSKLGTIGGRASKSAQEAALKVAAPEFSSRRRGSSSTTDGDSDNAGAQSFDDVSDHATNARTATPRKSKLGVIGGSKKPSSTAAQKDDNSTARDRYASPEVGGRSVSARIDEKSSKTRSPGKLEMTVVSPRAKTMSPPKSSQERADEEREKLKRQLEAMAQAPAKKKRRF